jgi:hypothetical protein
MVQMTWDMDSVIEFSPGAASFLGTMSSRSLNFPISSCVPCPPKTSGAKGGEGPSQAWKFPSKA